MIPLSQGLNALYEIEMRGIGSYMMVQVQRGALTAHGYTLMTISEYTIKWFSEHVISSFKQLSYNFDSITTY